MHSNIQYSSLRFNVELDISDDDCNKADYYYYYYYYYYNMLK